MALIITPVIGNVLVALTTRFGAVLPTIQSYLGEPISSDTPTDFVIIGSDGDPESEAIANFNLSWVDLGQTRQREDGEVPCAVISQTGEDDPASTFLSASATLSACVSDLVNDPTLGGICKGCLVTAGSAQVQKNANGTFVVVPFTVSYWAHV